ncbi:MAG: LuxR C-terminal-related transcriptional regulator [Microbacterium sp.]
MGISDNTVKFHVSNLLRKTGARSRGELTAIAASSTRNRT